MLRTAVLALTNVILRPLTELRGGLDAKPPVVLPQPPGVMCFFDPDQPWPLISLWPRNRLPVNTPRVVLDINCGYPGIPGLPQPIVLRGCAADVDTVLEIIPKPDPGALEVYEMSGLEQVPLHMFPHSAPEVAKKCKRIARAVERRQSDAIQVSPNRRRSHPHTSSSRNGHKPADPAPLHAVTTMPTGGSHAYSHAA